MKFRLMNFLVCPGCGRPMQCTVAKELLLDCPAWKPQKKCSPCALGLLDPAADDHCAQCATREIISGTLTCSCGCIYPIIEGVPILLAGQTARKDTLQEHNHKTSQRFGYEWTRYPACFYDEEVHIFFEEAQLQPQELRGKLILDAGCGMGRFTRITGSHNGEVIGVDLSESVHKAHTITEHLPNVHVIQGDLLRLPFQNAIFDIVYSLGVLHHTPSTKKSFDAVAAKLKEGGLLSIWVYGTAGKYENFKTNPLRPERSCYLRSDFFRRIYWLLVLLREKLSNILRRITVALPHRFLYRLCYIPALMGKVPLIKYCTFSVHADWRVRLLENFDWLAPPFQHHHTKEEVAGWFRQQGFEPARMLAHGFIPKIGILGRKLLNR